MTVQVHDARLPGGMLEVDTDDPKAAAAAAQKYIAAQKPAPAAPPPPQPNTYSDVIKSAARGLSEGAAAFGDGAAKVGALLQPSVALATMRNPAVGQAVMNGGSLNDVFSKPIPVVNPQGGYHQPQTTAGKYAETIASFAPSIAAPGGIATRLARPLVSGTTSEAAREVAQSAGASPGWQTAAGTVGALAGAGIPSIASAGMRIANKGAEAVTGSGFLNPNIEAARRLSGAFASDGGLPAALDKNASFTTSGASSPSVLDLGGGNVRRLVRAAAGGGDEAHNVATTYADRIRANLQDNVISRANQLTPGDARTAGQAATDLERGQDGLATEQYREPYRQPAAVNRNLVSALQGQEGVRMIRTAISDASANRDHAAMGELQDLLSVATEQGAGRNPLTGQIRTLDEALGGLSAGSLDRVRIATRETARGLAAAGRNYRARGYFGRMGDIDTALDQTPGLTDARASYRQMQASRDSVDAGSTVLSSPSANYSAQISQLAGVGGPPNLRPLQVGARQAITDAVEAPAAGQTGILTKLGTSNRATANLANTFGADRAASFQDAVRNEVSRLRNANIISPETGSQTEGRLADRGLVGAAMGGIHGLVSSIADKILRGTQLTAAEREAIVRLGTSEADVRRFATQRPAAVVRAAAPAALINSSRAHSSQGE